MGYREQNGMCVESACKFNMRGEMTTQATIYKLKCVNQSYYTPAHLYVGLRIYVRVVFTYKNRQHTVFIYKHAYIVLAININVFVNTCIYNAVTQKVA